MHYSTGSGQWLVVTNVMLLCIGYTPRCRSLRDLHYQGPQARGGVRSVETKPKCVTDLYRGAMGYVALTTHLRPSNYSIGHKRLKCVPSNNSNHCSKVLSIESDAGYRWPLADSIFCPVLTSFLTFRTTVLSLEADSLSVAWFVVHVVSSSYCTVVVKYAIWNTSKLCTVLYIHIIEAKAVYLSSYYNYNI